MKKAGLVILIGLTLSLTGCIHKYQVSDEKSDVVAEYMAATLLKHDEDYQTKLIDMEEFQQQEENQSENSKETSVPTPTAEKTDIQNNNNEASTDSIDTKKDYTINEVLGATGFDIQYKGYKVYDFYPEDSANTYFSLIPNEGNQLLVTTFSVKNITDKKKKLNLMNSSASYQLDINVGNVYKPILTLLENDLRNINMSIKADKKENVVLIFELSKNINMKDINLIISNDDKSEIINIK